MSKNFVEITVRHTAYLPDMQKERLSHSDVLRISQRLDEVINQSYNMESHKKNERDQQSGSGILKPRQ